MIAISRDGTKVKITLDPNMWNGKTMDVHWDCGSDWYAQLLTQRLRDLLFEKLRQIRAEAYQQGWKDKSAHKTKQDWFSGQW